MLASRSLHNSLTSLGGNPGGGPYPTAPVGPLQVPQIHDLMPRRRSPSLSPKPRSPRYSTQSQPGSRRTSPPSRPPLPQQQQQRRPSPPSHNNSYGPGPGSAPVSPRPVPNPATGFPSFTAGRNVSFEKNYVYYNTMNVQMLNSII